MPPETIFPDPHRDNVHASRFDPPSPLGLVWRAFSHHAPLYVAGLFFVCICLARPNDATSPLGLARLAGSAALLFCLLYGGRILLASLVRLAQTFSRPSSYHMARDDDRDVPDK